MSEWIKCSEQMPENGVQVWASNGKAQFQSCWWHGSWVYGGRITHWMPLPDLPKGDE